MLDDSARSAQEAASGRDAWDRIRDGMDLRYPDRKRIRRTIDWYRKNQKYLHRVTQRARPYLAYIAREVEKRELPMEFALLPVVESAFRERAYSPAGASGLWQFMPSTGRRYGLKQNWWYDGRRDVVESTRAALDYLTMLLQEFGNDPLLAVAAYNWGEGNIRRAMARNRAAGKPTDVWSLRLPRETRTHVYRFVAIAEIVEEAGPIRRGPGVDSRSGVLSSGGARRSGRACVRREAGGNHGQRAPPAQSRLQTFGDRTRGAAPPAAPCGRRRPIHHDTRAARERQERTLDPSRGRVRGHARHHRRSLRDEREGVEGHERAGLGSDYRRHPSDDSGCDRTARGGSGRLHGAGTSLREGDRVHHGRGPGDHESPRPQRGLPVANRPPARGGSRAARRLERPFHRVRPGARPAADRTSRAFRAGACHTAGESAEAVCTNNLHIVQYGDTLSEIAARHGTTVLALSEFNRIHEDAVLHPGQTLRLSPAGYAGGQRRIRYRVKRGDSLWEISRQFGVSVASLRRWNRLSANDLLIPGRELFVHLSDSPTI